MSNIPAPQWSAPWVTDDRCTQHQARQAELDLAAWLNGAPHVAFDAFKSLLQPICDKFAFSLLEIGSGAGYYLPVFRSFVDGGIYRGLDVSPHMVEYAREKYRDVDHSIFHLGECANTVFANSVIDCVCLAAVIQHLPDYRPALDEAVRVSRKYVLLHRVEATSKETYVYENPAYDTVLPTRIINESELFAECEQRGLMLVASEKWGVGDSQWNASYLWEKAS